MKNLTILIVAVVIGWFLWHQPKANWKGQVAPNDPIQTETTLPSPWVLKNYTITPRASYQINAVILSKHHYWLEDVDKIAPYDLALGWGAMSDANVINQLHITQSGRWYNYTWRNNPPIPMDNIISHSANTHIVPADHHIQKKIASLKRHQVVTLNGYLVDITDKSKNWHWNTSMSRTDSAGGSCELFWVTDVKR